jgi:hypothetical protein
MSNFPFFLDSDADLIRVDDNITQLGGIAINQIRSAIFAIEQEVGADINGVAGTGASGTAGSIAARLNVSILPDGNINPSILLGLLTNLGGIVDVQVSPTAAIQESKIALTYSTASLYTLYTTLKTSVDILNGFLSLTGIKLEPHIDGTNYNHLLSAIFVDPSPAIVKTNPGALPSSGTNVVNRNTTNADDLIIDMNTDLVVHEKSDSTPGVTATSGGTVPPENYAHMASGVFVDSGGFIAIPETNNNVQLALDYIDSSSLLLIGSRIQNFYENGVSRTSRSSSLFNDGYGSPIVPPTPAIAYFLNVPPGPAATSPVDDFMHGDDVILFQPTAQQLSTFNFDAQFSQVSPGDLLTINYGTGISYQFIVDSIKVIPATSTNILYAVRINGKNPVSNTAAVARIDSALFNRNKYAVLATVSAPNQINAYESLIVINPRSALALGNGFNGSEFDSNHYNLYLALLPNGDTSNIFFMPPIDVTANKGTTPGSYTLDSVVNNINTAVRQPGFNFRFNAFEYDGQIGIACDQYNNTAFSIISGVVNTNGVYFTGSNNAYPQNVVDNFNVIDPLGFGSLGSNIASPPPVTAYSNVNAARFAPTLVFYPLKRNFFYADGVERDQLESDPLILNSIQDVYGDGYWPATITTINTLSSRVEVVYTVNLFLGDSGLAVGKTLVVQPTVPTTSTTADINYGRFIISGVSFTNCPGPDGYTNITVYDAVSGTGSSPLPILPIGSAVSLYFSNDSVSFDAENVFDLSGVTTMPPYKRFFEVYVDGNGHTTTHERARFVTTDTGITAINLYEVSPKILGYTTDFGKEIQLSIYSFDQTTGIFIGQLGDPATFTILGPITAGQQGEVTRFYDATNTDYIDLIFTANTTIPSFGNQTVNIQLFPTFSLDQQFMEVGSCQVDDTTKSVSYIKDERQFGNVSEEQLSNSAIEFITAIPRELNENGIISGFDILQQTGKTISFSGGQALVNGNIIQINPQTITIPTVLEALPTTIGGPPTTTSTVNVITWFLCVNDQYEIELIASTDYDPLGSFAMQYTSVDLNHLRLFYVMNPSVGSPVPYQIRGTCLANLILTQQDVTPFAFVVATVTNPGTGFAITSLSASDARRYVTNGYGGLTDPFTLGNNAAFRNIFPLVNWLSQLNNFVSSISLQANPISNKVIVKGHVEITNTVSLIFINGEVYFEGDNGTFDILIPTGFNLTDNVHFDRVNFNYYYDPVVNYYSPPYTLLTGTFNVQNGNKSVATSTSQVGVLPVGAVITFGAQLGVLYTVSSVSSGSITLTSNYNGTSNTTSTASYSGYNTVDLINTGNAAIYLNVQTIARNISITNCHFFWTPQPLSIAINRYSFINIELDQPSLTFATILQSVNISNNTFQDGTLLTFSAVALETQRAVISFISKSVVGTANFPGNGMKLIDIIVRDNVCDKDQMIVVAPTYSSVAGTIANTINTTGVYIENNTCGVISVYVQYDIPLDFDETLTFNFLNFTLDKNNGLIVRGNICKYITSTDSTGFDLAYAALASLVSTGPMIISDNTTSWIRLPLSGGAAPCVIKNNTLIAYDQNFQKKFTSAVINNAAIEISYIGTPTPGTPINTPVIDGNFINFGSYSTVSPSITSYFYDVGIWILYHDANICNNLIANLAKVESGINPNGVWLETLNDVTVHVTINNNKFYRVSAIWNSYIYLGNDGEHTVADNYFDQITVDGNLAHFESSITGNLSLSSIRGNVNLLITEALSLMDNQLCYVSQGQSSLAVAQTTIGPAQSFTNIITDITNSVVVGRFTQNALGANVTPGSTSMYTGAIDFWSPLTPVLNRNVSFTVPLSARLPQGIKILSLSMGVWLNVNGSMALDISTIQTGAFSAQQNNAISLTINAYRDNRTSNSAFPLGVLDVKNNIVINPFELQDIQDLSYYLSNSSTILIGGTPSSGSNANGTYAVITPATLQASTHILNVTLATPLTTGLNSRIAAQVDLNYLRTAAGASGNTLAWYISPIVVTYTW